MNSRKIIQLVVFLALGGFLVWFSVKDLNTEERALIWSSIKGVNVWALLVMFAIGTLSHVARAIRWKIIAGEEHQSLTYADYFFSIMAGYLANLALPRLGEVTRCGLLARYRKADFSRLFGTVVFERLFDVICLGIVFLLALAFEYKVFYPYAEEHVMAPLKKMLSPAILVALVSGIAIAVAMALYLLRKTTRSEHPLLALLNRFLNGLTGVMALKKPGAFFFWTVVIWLLYWGGLVAGFYAVQPLQELNWTTGFPLLIGSSLAMIVVQGGIGSFPYFISQILALYAIAKPPAIAYGWVCWLLQTLVVLLWGFLAFLYFALNKTKDETAVTR